MKFNCENLKLAVAQLCHDLQVCNADLQVYNAIADPKVDGQHIYRKYFNCNSFQVTTDLLNRQNLKVAIAQLCNEYQVCNFTMV